MGMRVRHNTRGLYLPSAPVVPWSLLFRSCLSFLLTCKSPALPMTRGRGGPAGRPSRVGGHRPGCQRARAAGWPDYPGVSRRPRRWQAWAMVSGPLTQARDSPGPERHRGGIAGAHDRLTMGEPHDARRNSKVRVAGEGAIAQHYRGRLRDRDTQWALRRQCGGGQTSASRHTVQ